MSLCPICGRYLFMSHARAHSCIVLQFLLLHVSISLDFVSPSKVYLPMAPKKHVPKCNPFSHSKSSTPSSSFPPQDWFYDTRNYVAFKEDFLCVLFLQNDKYSCRSLQTMVPNTFKFCGWEFLC